MRLSEISFCDKVGYNIRSDETKKYFLNKIENIYGIKIIARHFDKFVHVHTQNILNKNPYLVCLRSNGNPYLMFITKYNDNDIVILIDKKIQQGYFLPRMILVHLMIGNETSGLHNDTIFDGEMVKRNDNTWTYLINDMYVHKGQYLSDVNIIRRLNSVYTILKTEYIPDEMTPFNIMVKKYFTYDELKKDIYTHIQKLNYTCRGIYFKPLFLKFKDILLNFDDTLIKKVKRDKVGGNFLLDTQNETCEIQKKCTTIEKRNINANKSEIANNATQNTINENMRVFLTRKTSQPDVYEILDVNGEVIGDACIPTLKISTYMRDLFKEKNLVDRVRINYTWNTKFEKWTPNVIVNS